MPLKLVKYPQRSPLWYLRGTIRGQTVFETTGTDDRAAAEILRIKRESELLERSVLGPLATVTFAEAALSYLESGGEARFLGRYDDKKGEWTLLLGHFGTTPLRQISQTEVDDAAFKLLPKAGPATRKRHVYGPVCAVLNHAAKRRWCNPPVIEHPKVPLAQTRYSTPERLAKLLPHCRSNLRRLVVTMVYTGARLSEALRIVWDRDIDLTLRTVRLMRTKNGKTRTGSIPDALMAELTAVAEGRRHGLLFPDWKSKKSVHRPLKNACKRAGVDYLPPHQQGRHTYATWLRIYAKRDLRGLMEDGGWDSVQSVIRYLKVVPGETAAAVDLLPTVNPERKKNGGTEVSYELREKRRQNRESSTSSSQANS